MAFLSRNKVYTRLEPSKDAKKLFIFCEGERREIEYFKFFQGFSSNIDIIPITCEDGKSDPEKLKDQAIIAFDGDDDCAAKYSLSEEYEDEIWFVIDTDRWNENNKIEILRDFCNKKNEKYTGWFVAQSNPCFELWLFYHFNETRPEEKEVEPFKSFKAYVGDKIKGGFNNRTMPIQIQEAIRNSEANFESEDNQPKLFSTEVHILGNKILPFVVTEITQCIKATQSPIVEVSDDDASKQADDE